MSVSATTVHDSLSVIAEQGWDGPEGDRLLREVRSKVVAPQVSAARLTGPAAEQAEASGWEAAWQSLADPAFAQVRDPWAMLWIIARRAVLGEAVASRYLTSERRAWRLRQSSKGTEQADHGSGWAPSPLSLDLWLARGQDPVEPAVTSPSLGRRLEAVASAMARAGWRLEMARDCVEAVAMDAARDGKLGNTLSGWRSIAAALDLPPWRVRRVTVLLCGAPGWPGVLEQMVTDGDAVVDTPGMRAALRSTVRSSDPVPHRAAARAERFPAREQIDVAC